MLRGSLLALVALILMAMTSAAQEQERKLGVVATAHLDTQWRWTIQNTIDEYMRQILTEKQHIIDTVVDGKLISIARDKSFFKEFVQLVQHNYSKDIGKYNEVDDIEIEG